jgi:hypothetical protein
MEPLKRHARLTQHLAAFQYLDDWLLLFGEPNEAAQQTVAFAEECLNLGLLVNLDKSELHPTRSITHLGILWDLQTAWVQPALKQIGNITQGARLMLQNGKATVKMLESLQGKLVAAEKCTQYGRINYRLFQRFVTKMVHSFAPQTWIRIPDEVKPDLKWWSTPKHLQLGAPCVYPAAQIEVTTDASDRGWSAYWGDNLIAGTWSNIEKMYHINKKELSVVLFALKKWGGQFNGQSVLFWLDNRTAVSYVCKQGGTRSASLMQLARSIFQIASSFNIWISAAYIPGILNVVADMHSRIGLVLKTEWTLSLRAFNWVCQASLVGLPQVDLFANNYTKQLPRFGSPCPELGAEIVDALNSPWPNTVLYAFPPTCIMDKVVLKMQKERPKALVLVASRFPKAAWFPFLTKWEHTMQPIPSEVLSLTQPHFKHLHPNPDTLCLAVYSISYKN